MDFDFSEEQQLFRDSLTRLLGDRYDFERRKTYLAGEGWSREAWRDYAELGLLGVPFPEEFGGFGGGLVEVMITQEAFGRAMALEPYLATVVLAGGIIRHGGTQAQREALLPAIAGGEAILAFAHGEEQARYDLFDVETRVRQDGEGYVIDGVKSVVLAGAEADHIIVSARSGGDSRDTDGIGLFIVDAGAPGLTTRGYALQDGRRAAELTFEGVRVGAEAVLGDPGGALPLITRVTDEAIAANAADMVGCMDEMLALTVEYLKTRKQFGTAIGSFQVLQHRASEMFVALELARSMTFYAVMMAQEEDAAARRAALSAAKVQLGRSARFVGQNAIQLHGGVGMTMEYRIGHLFKRLSVNDLMFGDADHHLALVAAGNSLIAA